jgi:hypothetical protein
MSSTAIGAVPVMPQPLSRVAKDANIVIGNAGMRTLRHRPELGLMAMEAIAEWSTVESFMLRMYVQLAGGAETDSAAMYLSLEIASAKSKAIATLAERKLEPNYVDLLKAIIKISKTWQKDRDKLAHWEWGFTDDLKDAILLVDPRNINLDKNSIFVYKAADFEDIRGRFERLSGFAHDFYFIIRGHVSNRNERLYERLCSTPEIAEILNRLI